MTVKINIATKANRAEELSVKQLLEEILEMYDCPAFTEKIIVETDAISHSHPVLTIGTSWFVGKDRVSYGKMEKEGASLRILENYLHEQFHWFLAGSPGWRQGIDYLKERYADPGEGGASGNEIIFWVHLAVIWNTKSYLQKILAQEQFTFIYSGWRPYPKTEKLVEEKFEQLRVDLGKFGLSYQGDI